MKTAVVVQRAAVLEPAALEPRVVQTAVVIQHAAVVKREQRRFSFSFIVNQTAVVVNRAAFVVLQSGMVPHGAAVIQRAAAVVVNLTAIFFPLVFKCAVLEYVQRAAILII